MEGDQIIGLERSSRMKVKSKVNAGISIWEK
jgi:hypothetical protein